MRLEWPLRREEMSRILIADDQRDVLEALRILLKGEGYQTEAATSLAGIFNSLEKKEYALVLMDLNYARDTTSGQEGLSAIPRIRQIDNALPIVVMTAWATVELAVEAMKRGARDFVTKPWDNQRLLAIVGTQIELASALRRERKLEAENELLRGTMPSLIAESPAMKPVIEMISRVAPSDANILITGENGTGKSLIARAIHALSPRTSHAMITVNMGGLSETLFESEVAAGRFRQDLLFRLNTIQITLPPLRERREDIMPLANSFIRQHAEHYRKQISGFDETAREQLLQHRFPGNVRELDHIVERAVLMTQDQQIRAPDLGLTNGGGEPRNLEEMSLEEVEAFLIKKALARNDGNARKAAEALGLSRSAFYRRLQQYGL